MDMGFGDLFYSHFYENISTADLPPVSGWQVSEIGVAPLPELINYPNITYSNTVFVENNTNNGSIYNYAVITHNNQDNNTFSGINNDDFFAQGKVNISNVPTGLTPALIRTDSLTLRLSFTGNAVANSSENNLNNISIQFLPSAFSNNSITGVGGVSKTDYEIKFFGQFGSNIIQNPGAELDFANWNIISTDGSAWIVDSNSAKAHSENKRWVTGNGGYSIQQTIDLTTVGYSAAVLDEIHPICTGIYVYPGWDFWGNTGKFDIKAELLDASDNVLATNQISYDEGLGVVTYWVNKLGYFYTYPTGVRKFRMTLAGHDGNNWAGNYGPSFDDAYAYIDQTVPMPVELSSFSAEIIENKVSLTWTTSNEKNNFGFNIEKKSENGEWILCGFIEGNGNSNSPKTYNFSDDCISSVKQFYRLKQIDQDGSFAYSKVLEVNPANPEDFNLFSNYPNPFNPSTKISYSLNKEGLVILNVFSVTGQLVKQLVSSNQKPGIYNIDFKSDGLSSGVYLVALKFNGKTITQKMVIAK